jgi:hypothetical protein
LAGCPNNALTETGESYIDEAVLVNEKAKYATAVVLELDEGDAGTDVTDQFMQLSPGKNADHEVAVSISGAGGEGFFNLDNGRLFFTGQMPMSKDAYEQVRSGLKSAVEAEADPETKASLQALLDEMDGVPNTEVITLNFRKGETDAALDVLAVVQKKGGKAAGAECGGCARQLFNLWVRCDQFGLHKPERGKKNRSYP